MRFIRVLPLVLLAVALTGCAGRAEAGKIAAIQEIAAGDKLLAAKDYDAALSRYIKAANETTASPVHDEALSKAAGALAQKVDSRPLPQQVAAFKEFLGQIPDPILPLRAHNWLSDTLREEAEAAVKVARAASAENKRVMTASTPPKTTPKKPAPKKTTAAKKPAAKPKTPAKPAVAKTATATVVTTSAAVATVSVAATRTAVASAPAEPVYVFPSAAELKAVSESLSALGQPPAMEQLYAALAEVKSAMDGCEAARAPFAPRRPLTLAQRRTLAAADARLSRALQKIDTLFASL